MGHRKSGTKILSRVAAASVAGLALGTALAACGSSSPGSRTSSDTRVVDDVDSEGTDNDALQVTAIADALNEFGPAVHTCWARAAAVDFRLEGQVVLAVELLGGGASRVEIAEQSIESPVLTECLVTLWSDYQWPAVFDKGDRVQLPPFEFVAPDAQYTVASAHVPVAVSPKENAELRTLISEGNTGNAQAVLSLLSAKDGYQQKSQSHPGSMILYVLAGTASFQSHTGPQSVQPGTALYVPAGTEYSFQQTGRVSLELAQFLAVTTAKPAQSKLLLRETSESQVHTILGGDGKVRIVFDESITGDKSAYIGALTAQPGAAVPPHRHSGSSEYLFVIEGQAEMKIAGKSIPVRAGDAVQIPPGVEHSALMSGTETFKALQYYAPPGPEQRFKGTLK